MPTSLTTELGEAREIDAVAVIEDARDEQLPIFKRRLEVDGGGRDLEFHDLGVGRQLVLGGGCAGEKRDGENCQIFFHCLQKRSYR